MAVVYTKKDQGNSVTTGTGAPTHTAVAGDRYTDTATGNTYQYTTSWQTVSYSAGGLTYFTESQNTTVPNATVPVDSLTAVTGTTNGDFAILPKGSGAILSAIPDSTATGGNKRGTYALDLQMARLSSGCVASGNYSVTLGYNNTSSGIASFSVGYNNISSGLYSVTLGTRSFASGIGSLAGACANLGSNSATNDGSVALGGYNSTASGAYSIALSGGTSSGSNSFSVQGTASGNNSIALGSSSASAQSTNSIALGDLVTASGAYSMATMWMAETFSHRSRMSYGTYITLNGSPSSTTRGEVQGSTLVVGVDTNSVTPASLRNYNGLAIALILQNNNSIRFKGTIVARQTATTNTSAWDIDGFIQRGTTAATTTLLISNVNVVQNTPAWVTPTLTADTVNGGLDIKVTGVVTNLIKWSCVLTTTEVILA